MKLLSQIHTALLYPMARVIVEGQSARARIRSWGRKPTVHLQAPYAGQPVLLIALYERGALRPDILRLLDEAKRQGMYVLAVNTLKLRDPASVAGKIDCYIERPNFGRDFGSYKTGFEHFYAQGWENTCPRLIMVNDSIYFSTRGLAKFLTDLLTSEIEVLGATENFQMEYHLGSFCITMSQSVLKTRVLRDYWRTYRNSDIRPTVIRRGEMQLSRTLKRCVTSPDQFRALYSTSRFLDTVITDKALQDLLLRDARTSPNHNWPRFDARRVEKILDKRVLVRHHELDPKTEVRLQGNLDEADARSLLLSRDDVVRHLMRHVKGAESGIPEDVIGEAFAAAAVESFQHGSQVHQNAAILLELGLPFVKLDGHYRGLFNGYDVIRLKKKLPPLEAEELGRLLLERPFGADNLVGWKRAAFNLGLI